MLETNNIVKQEAVDIVIMGTVKDPHIEYVLEHLSKYDVNIAFLDLNNSSKFSILQNRQNFHCSIDGKIADENTIFWSRTKLYYGSPFYFREYSTDRKNFEAQRRIDDWREQEWNASVKIISLLNEDRLISKLSSSALMYKVNQQKFAAELGMNTIDTLITNDVSAAQSFVEKYSQCISKSISGKKVLPGPDELPTSYGVMTVKITPEDLSNLNADAFAECPHLFQQCLEKDYELRILDIDGELFPFKIDSGKFKHTELDWRHGYRVNDELFKLTTIDKNLSNMLTKFREHYGLFSGSFDFIVKDGVHYFLECNKEGAWAWLDHYVDGRIGKTFAKKFYGLIMERRNARCA